MQNYEHNSNYFSPSSYVWLSQQKQNMFIMKLILYYWLNLSTYCQSCKFTVDEMVPTEGFMIMMMEI